MKRKTFRATCPLWLQVAYPSARGEFMADDHADVMRLQCFYCKSWTVKDSEMKMSLDAAWIDAESTSQVTANGCSRTVPLSTKKCHRSTITLEEDELSKAGAFIDF